MPTDELAGIDRRNCGPSVATRDWVELEYDTKLRRMRSVSSMNAKRINHNVNMLHGKPTAAAVPVSSLVPYRILLSASLLHPHSHASQFSLPLSLSSVRYHGQTATIKSPRGTATAGKRRFPSQFDLRRNFATVWHETLLFVLANHP